MKIAAARETDGSPCWIPAHPEVHELQRAIPGKNDLASRGYVDSTPAMDVPCKAKDEKCAALFREQVATYTHAFENYLQLETEHAWLVTPTGRYGR